MSIIADLDQSRSFHRAAAVPRLTHASPVRAVANTGAVRSITLIGNFPPRRCGIATFTCDVHEALVTAYPDARVDVIAMTDAGAAYDYPDAVSYTVRQDAIEDYHTAARRLRQARPDVICVQHEFGIFGGAAGAHLMLMLDAVDAPVVTTLHTILETPNDDQRRVLDRLIARSSAVIVMAERGREILRRVWNVAAEKIEVIPHGVPDRPLRDTAQAKRALGLDDRPLLLTFGLLSPGKGIERMIEAMPAVVAAEPRALYMVLGATHPHLLAREGEAYRERLGNLATSLGVADNVRFINAFVERDELLDYLAAADLYITPYLNEAQITSGTLSYAVALGKPVISTPYWHAAELLADGRGVLAPFNNAPALAEAAIDLLSDPDALDAVRHRAYDASRDMIWSRLAARYMAAFQTARAESRPARSSVRKTMPRPNLTGVRRMSDSCGMMQHSLFGIPDRAHGYCVDDNARALQLMLALGCSSWPDLADEQITETYAAFLQHAWNEDKGRFRNFMAYDRAWLEEQGSEDSFGRSVLAVCTTVAQARSAALRQWAHNLAGRFMPHLGAVKPLRTRALVVLGLCRLLEAEPERRDARDLLLKLSYSISAQLEAHLDGEWVWFEDHLSYDNARLPEALLRAGALLADQRLTDEGLGALDWLCAIQTSPEGFFRPVGSEGFGKVHAVEPDPFDQQPLEALATIDACTAAFRATGDARWVREAQRAYAWFTGENDLGQPLALPDAGGCYDGLTPEGPNLNQGAESVLAFQLSTCAIHALVAAATSEIRPQAAAVATEANPDLSPSQGRTSDRCPSSITARSASSPIRRGSLSGPSTSLQSPSR